MARQNLRRAVGVLFGGVFRVGVRNGKIAGAVPKTPALGANHAVAEQVKL